MCYNILKMNRIDGRYIRNLREDRGYSLRTFADMIYVSKSSLQRWEQTSVPENEDVIKKIAEAFGMTEEELRLGSEREFGKTYYDDGLTPDQRAQARFGVKGLGVAATVMGVVIALSILLPVIVSLFAH